jgi:hypothetical protein
LKKTTAATTTTANNNANKQDNNQINTAGVATTATASNTTTEQHTAKNHTIGDKTIVSVFKKKINLSNNTDCSFIIIIASFSNLENHAQLLVFILLLRQFQNLKITYNNLFILLIASITKHYNLAQQFVHSFYCVNFKT